MVAEKSLKILLMTDSLILSHRPSSIYTSGQENMYVGHTTHTTLTNSMLPCSLLQLKLILSFVIAEEKMDSSEGLMYNVDLDGGTLLHLAANSGVLAVSLPKQFSLYA